MKRTDNSQPTTVKTTKSAGKFAINYDRAGLSQPQPIKAEPVRGIGSPLNLAKLVAAAKARARVNALMGF